MKIIIYYYYKKFKINLVEIIITIINSLVQTSSKAIKSRSNFDKKLFTVFSDEIDKRST